MWEKAEKETLLKSLRAPGTKMELTCVDIGTKVSVEIPEKKKKKRRRGNIWNHMGAEDTEMRRKLESKFGR